MENQRVHQNGSQVLQTVLRNSEVPIYSVGSNLLDLLRTASGIEKIIFVDSKNQDAVGSMSSDLDVGGFKLPQLITDGSTKIGEILWDKNRTGRDSLVITEDDGLVEFGQVQKVRSRGEKMVDKMISSVLSSIVDQPLALIDKASDEEDGWMEVEVFHDVVSSSYLQPVLLYNIHVYYGVYASIDFGNPPTNISSRGGVMFDVYGNLVNLNENDGGYGGDDRRGDDGGRNGRRPENMYAAGLVRPKFRVSVELEDWHFDCDDVRFYRMEKVEKRKEESLSHHKYYKGYNGYKKRHYGKKKLSPRQEKGDQRIFYYE